MFNSPADNKIKNNHQRRKRLMRQFDIIQHIIKSEHPKQGFFSLDEKYLYKPITYLIIEGPHFFIHERDLYYHNESEHYISELRYETTIFDLFKLFSECMDVIKDYHHWYLEDFYEVKLTEFRIPGIEPIDGVKYYAFGTGS